MNFKVINKTVAVADTLFDGFDEQPVDSDFVLPDYYPDIAAVLKCTLKPVVQSKQISGDRVLVDGMTYIQVLYLDEDRKCVRRCEFTKPFTSSFAVKSGMNSPCLMADAKTDYVNCRATSPRRLDIHGSFNVRLKVQAESGNEVVTDMEGDTVHTRKSTAAFSVPAAMAEKVISVNEVLDLGTDASAAADIVRSDAVPVLTDCRLLAGKAVVKGELKLRTLYTTDEATGSTECAKHDIPFSQIIDVEGLEEDFQCDVRLDLIALDITVASGQSGDGRLLEAGIKLLAQIQCHRAGTAEVVTDAYSTKCPLKLETRQMHTSQLTDILTNSSMVHEKLELPSEEVDSVLDIWCDASVIAQRCENDKTIIDGRLIIFMLARDASGIISFYERPSDFVCEYEDAAAAASVDVRVIGVDYSTGASALDINVELSVTRRCYRSQTINAVVSAEEDDSATFQHQKAALKIYFASGGESVWEVAKACHTSTEAVMEENGLSGDILPGDTMLLVPLC